MSASMPPPSSEDIAPLSQDITPSSENIAASAEAPGSDRPHRLRCADPENAHPLAALDHGWSDLIDAALYHRNIPRPDREDLHQDVLETMLGKPEHVVGPQGKVVKFAKGVAHNLKRNELKKAKLDVKDGADVDTQPVSTGNPERGLDRKRVLEKLDGYLQRLPKPRRDMFVAHFLGMPFEVIAEAVGRNDSFVHDEYHRARRDLLAMILASGQGSALAAEVLGPEALAKAKAEALGKKRRRGGA